MSKFTIVVDSSCDLPAEYLHEHGIEILPMPFELDGKAYPSGYWQEISAKEYYGAMRNGSIAKTSQVNSWTFATAFTEYAKQGRGMLFIGLSSGLTGSFKCAEAALREVKELYPDCGVFLVDSLFASSGHGLLTMLAVKKREEGLSVGETAAWLENKKHSCMGFFTVDDLMYLHRGGRLSKLSAVAGSVLGVKPILTVAPDGTLKIKAKVRGRQAALRLMLNQLLRCVDSNVVLDTVLVNHTDCLEDAQIFAEMIKKAVKVRNIIIMAMGPIVGAHIGPGAITLLFEAGMTREEYECLSGKE